MSYDDNLQSTKICKNIINVESCIFMPLVIHFLFTPTVDDCIEIQNFLNKKTWLENFPNNYQIGIKMAKNILLTMNEKTFLFVVVFAHSAAYKGNVLSNKAIA